ncbi:Vps5 C terminal like-domain-containing protein [Epithele typhae]|uniref:Vps5 C terminal like-domain-containing protein n=1 Tax=Epithele typhae TaxID=378194 RepID=UPI00200760C0|nr:Vps5 C terminal like-domain-containing protein [Epithele typhae]KAH9943262.1 Vps5 C terminal like-domain-containing protein [Epithele typhae]
MFDPLSVPNFPQEEPPWPTRPHDPSDVIPNLPRPSPNHESRGPPAGLYGKEPQIYGQPDSGLISPRINPASNGTNFERKEPYLRVRITTLDRNRRDVLIKFDAQTNLSNFTGTTYRNVSRSYFEFQQFYETLILNNPQTIVPALPLARTSAPTDEEDDRLVKIMLQRWFTRVCEDPILIHEEELRSFVESDFGYQPTPSTRRKASGGFSLMRRGVPDEDEELQRARFELTKLEGQFFESAKAIDKLARARKSIAVVKAEMGNKLVNVSSTEAHPPLGNAMQKIGRVYHSLADLDQAQGISECVIIGDSLGYQGLNARSAKETLQQRTAVLEEYQAAVKATISKRRNMERLKNSSNISPQRVDEALEEMEEANKYEQILARRAEGISQNLHRALERHRRIVTEDVTAALVEHVRSTIMYERQHLRELEALRPEVSAADKKHVPQKPVTAPRPAYVPLSKTSPTHPSNVPPRTHRVTSSMIAPSHAPAPSSHTNGFPQGPLSAGPAPGRAPIPPQSPGAGPSSAATTSGSFARPTSDGPPLGGRLVDGTRSMFVKPPMSPLASTGPPKPPGTGLPPVPPSNQSAPISPLHASGPPSGSSHPLGGGGDPLSASTFVSSAIPGRSNSVSATLANDLDPLGMARPAYMSATVRTPTRPRLDAREAASKLANMF